MYVVRIACPTCGMQQTFDGTPSEIGAAVEVWNSGHQHAIHNDESDVPAWRRFCTPSTVDTGANHSVQQRGTVTRARNGRPGRISTYRPGCIVRPRAEACR